MKNVPLKLAMNFEAFINEKQIEKRLDEVFIGYPALKPFKEKILLVLKMHNLNYVFNHKGEQFRKEEKELSKDLFALKQFIKSATSDNFHSIKFSGFGKVEIKSKLLKNYLLKLLKNDKNLMYQIWEVPNENLRLKKEASVSSMRLNSIVIDLNNKIKNFKEYTGTNKQAKLISSLLYCIDIVKDYNHIKIILRKLNS